MPIPMFRKCLVIAGVLLAVTGLAPGMPARAADAPASALALFGSVDLQKILANYSKKTTYDQQIQQLNQRLNGYWDQQKSSPMLSAEDQAQLGTLLAKTPQSDQDKATITQLQQKSTQAVQDLAALQQKPNPTQDDLTRMAQLKQQQDAGQQALQDVGKGYQDQMQKANDDLSQKLTQEVRVAITEVAKVRGLAVVFDSSVAVYTSNDITDAVVKQLNK